MPESFSRIFSLNLKRNSFCMDSVFPQPAADRFNLYHICLENVTEQNMPSEPGNSSKTDGFM